MKAIHGLRWVYGVEHLRAVDLLGKRQLNQNAMYGRVGVELCYQREEFSLGAISTVAMLERSHPELAALLDLPPHIDVACRVVADQHRHHCRWGPVGLREIRSHMAEIGTLPHGRRPP